MNFIDQVSVIEINPTELCNLKCNFCPRSTYYPNLNLNMSIDTARLIVEQLRQINYTGEVSITGRGEPTLHPEFDELCEVFMEDRTWTLKINTNGKNMKKWFSTIRKFDHVIYNVYEEDEWHLTIAQETYGHIENFKINHKPMGMEWFDRKNFTNRAGSFDTNHLPEDGRCEVIFLKLFIDYDGTYRVCCEDWKTKIDMGNIYVTNIHDYVEYSEELADYRRHLIEGDRYKSPCSQCTHKITDMKYGCTPKRWEQLEWQVKTENLGV